jgi:thioredoxin-like negative regulator of GroEL
MHNTTPENFAADVGAGTTVVMFHASWCGPCKGMKPLVEALAAELGFRLIGVDAGEHRTLASVHGVRGVPTLTVFRDGAAQASVSGGQTDARLRSFLAAAGVPA